MTEFGGVAADQLRSFVERIERLEEEKKNISEDLKEVMAEAKSSGYDTKTIRKIVSLRKLEQNDLDEQEYLLETYRRALGMPSAFDTADEADAQATTTTEAA